MNLKKVLVFILLLACAKTISQNLSYSSLLLPKKLTDQANAVVRSSEVNVNMESINKMVVLERRIVTVLNKKGNDALHAVAYYDNNVKIKTLQALVFNSLGSQIKKVKKDDFRDVSAVDGGTLYSDSRLKYLEYTPIDYPYTVEFICETVTTNTAFIESFMPVTDYFVSVENSAYNLVYPEHMTIRTKEKNFVSTPFIKDIKSGSISYKVNNLEAFQPELNSPAFRNTVPYVMFASSEFNYEGVLAKADNWESMGKWFNDNLLKNRTILPQTTFDMVNDLVKDTNDPIERARRVYKFVQDNTRYISVQVGIGGMQPIAAINVDRVKYGDCKGLTNYTKSLLEAVGVTSYYTRLHASPQNIIDVDKEFVSFSGQTNHVILNLPQDNGDDIWLECTSQKLPFGFIGDFTDNRDVMVITPEGAKIKHTKKYATEENSQIIKGQYTISNTGSIDASAQISSMGIQYDNKYWLESETQRDLDVHYKKRWRYVNNIAINKMDILNDKDAIQFNESVNFSATNYAKLIGDRMLVNLNLLNRVTDVPDKYKERKLPLKINRGFVDFDEVEINLPPGFSVESLPENMFIENKFGSYKSEIITIDEASLLYKRHFVVHDGEYPKEDYEAYREFYKEVSKIDNSKMALIKNQP